jgi:arylsulfatase A-like enzyme/tetratricopeptide (TPR) repeat protein
MRVLAPLSALVLLSLLHGCGGDTPRASPADRPNVLLVTIDTLRADRVGCYGHATASTPVIDALAVRGVRFETSVAHAPLTGPSHASILSGQTPLGHGFRNNSGYLLAPAVRTAAEDFRQAGYRTAAFVSAFPLDRRFGFDRGFDIYDDRLPKGNDPRRTPYVERFADATTDAVLRWLSTSGTAESRAPVPWFIWAHYYDPHAPYEPPADLAARYGGAPYDGEIAFVDRELGRLLEELDTRGDTPRTIVLVTADHGESLGEHGEGTHGIFVYDATIRVPWVMAGPRIPAGRVSGTVARSIDVLPTLLDYAGLPPRTDVDGRSLRPAAEGHEMGDAAAYAESLYPELEMGWAPLHAWRTASFKFVKAPRPELYDLTRDATEQTNRIGEHAARASDLGSRLDAELRRPVPAATAPAVDPDAAERLRALGYASGGRISRPAPGTALRDPKDGIRLLPRLNRGMSAARTEPDLAIRELTAVLAEDPGLFMARRTRAVAYAAAGRHDLAIADLRALDKAGQLTPEDAVVLGDNLRSAGRLEEAALILERASRENPAFVQPLISLAEVRIEERTYDEAAALCERVLKLVPDHIEALRRLGDLALLRGDLQTAGARYGRILEIDGGDVAAMTKLGVVRVRSGRPDEGLRLFRQAVEQDAKNAEALLYLAGALASTGRSAEALPYFERALEVDPDSTMALNGLGLTRLAAGDREGAAAAFRRSLRVNPEQPDIARTLGELRGEKVDRTRSPR